jgi:hypothetical protein
MEMESKTNRQPEGWGDAWLDNKHLEEKHIEGRILLKCKTSYPFARYKYHTKEWGCSFTYS